MKNVFKRFGCHLEALCLKRFCVDGNRLASGFASRFSQICLLLVVELEVVLQCLTHSCYWLYPMDLLLQLRATVYL